MKSSPELIEINGGQTPSADKTGLAETNLSLINTSVQRPDGNRLLMGSGGNLTTTIDLPLRGRPRWIAAGSDSKQAVWFSVLENGDVQIFQILDGQAAEIREGAVLLPAGMPPVILHDDQGATLLQPPADASPFAPPVLLQDGSLVNINLMGSLALVSDSGSFQIEADCLPDARILVDETDRLLVLTNPTEAYPHGVLGDSLEAGSVSLVEMRENPIKIRQIIPKDGDVIEGIAPIWVDMDLDGSREIILTQSNEREGARIVVYREDGVLLAESDPIGQGFRWTHQLAATQFIEGGPLEIAAVRTPHIGGVLEIYRLAGESLELAASLGGFSSHVLGERNLDRALAADFNGDGMIELALPDQAQTTISGIQFTHGELAVVWEYPLDGELSTNLAGIQPPGGGLMLGAGTGDGKLRIWVFDK